MTRVAMLAFALGLVWCAPAQAASLEAFFGAYVGTADVEKEGSRVETRDVDIVISGHDDGFRIDWVNVSLIDGRRDVPSVVRRATTALFAAGNQPGVYLQSSAYNPFVDRTSPDPMGGDALRWASLEGDSLRMLSFQLLPDGAYELQVYDRTLRDDGLDLTFERVVDGRVTTRITGRAVRAKTGVEE
ncbi:hypothetical protein [Marinivivus vitaminiproducens]|uniref:hypothetical protein n=1 Tax=Marinivivus vitaminiproducens TaxID=3035935 RepID=UPI00279AFBD0|nr:hypothetical protein P4R82_05090 [Geminicoccaceae bacterium SCSIO 64248]